MNGRCDVCGRRAAYRLKTVEQGHRRTKELCPEHYEEFAMEARDFSSPFDSFFNDRFFRELFGEPGPLAAGQPGEEEPTPQSLGDREAVDLDTFLSEEAKQILHSAGQQAVENGKDAIDTEHLLHALLDNPTTQQIFRRFKLSIEDLKQHIENNAPAWKGEGEKPGPGEQRAVHFTPRVKGVLENAFRASRDLGHNYIGPEHLLIGLADLGEGFASDVLKAYGLTGPAIRQKVTKLVGRGTGEGRTTPESETPKLDQYSRDLTALAKEGKLDPVIGRSKEIATTIEVLARRTKNNPVLIGEPGVGKTAIVEGLAQRIINEEVPEVLRDKRLIELSINSMVAGSKYRGEFEERIKQVVDEITKHKEEIIVFIDEMHTIMGAGAVGAEGGLDVANVIKPSLARGELHLIGATTLNEYQKHIEKDAALERRFQPIFIEEPTVEQTVTILRGIRDRYEAHHKVKITDEAIVSAADLSDRYISNRHLPDKAIDLIDQAAARVRISATSRPGPVHELESELRQLQREKESALARNEYEKAKELDGCIADKNKEIEKSTKKWRATVGTSEFEVKPEHIAEIVSSITGIPVSELTQEEKEKLTHLEEKLHERIIGQEEAVRAVSEAVRLARAGLKPPRQPIATFLFLGPTGVGKTELARTLAWSVFGDEDAVVRVDMSEYMERHTVSRLIGAPPGYVGYEEGGQLTERVRRRPYSVVLLDEIEKAHPDVHNILLQVFDDGRLTDGKGRVVDFSNTIIIATSNIGSDEIRENLNRPEAKRKSHDELKSDLMNDLRAHFRPEFLNRIDEIIVFHALTQDEIRQIVKLQLEQVARIAQSQGIRLTFDDSLTDFLAKVGFQPEFGARELRRQIRSRVEALLAGEMLRGKINKGDEVTAVYLSDTDKIEFQKQKKAPAKKKKAA